MSKGAGTIERRIADLLAATRDRALSIDDITAHAFALAGAPPTRAQRLSATRATHRLLRRVREADARVDELFQQAHANTKAALGREKRVDGKNLDREYWDGFHADPAYHEGTKLHDYCDHIGRWIRVVPVEDEPGRIRVEDDFWCVITLKGRLCLHPPDVPVQVWAVSIGPGGITWADADILKITDRNVMVRYAGETARLDRENLWRWWAWWRGVRFVSSRTGRIAAELDKAWQKRYGTGTTPPNLQMPLAEAMALLGVPANYTKEDVIAGFRRVVKKAHPDVGGTAEMFRKLVQARDRLLAALGTSAPPPKPPTYAPKGVQVIYRAVDQRGRASARGHCASHKFPASPPRRPCSSS
jgi:hypothetical protein